MSAIRYAMFVKTVELQSLALAAGELCCTPSAVSHGISSLEAELGVKLMQRSRAGVKLSFSAAATGRLSSPASGWSFGSTASSLSSLSATLRQFFG